MNSREKHTKRQLESLVKRLDILIEAKEENAKKWAEVKEQKKEAGAQCCCNAYDLLERNQKFEKTEIEVIKGNIEEVLKLYKKDGE